jgi:hypothetical protein
LETREYRCSQRKPWPFVPADGASKPIARHAGGQAGADAFTTPSRPSQNASL